MTVAMWTAGEEEAGCSEMQTWTLDVLLRFFFTIYFRNNIIGTSQTRVLGHCPLAAHVLLRPLAEHGQIFQILLELPWHRFLLTTN